MYYSNPISFRVPPFFPFSRFLLSNPGQKNVLKIFTQGNKIFIVYIYIYVCVRSRMRIEAWKFVVPGIRFIDFRRAWYARKRGESLMEKSITISQRDKSFGTIEKWNLSALWISISLCPWVYSWWNRYRIGLSLIDAGLDPSMEMDGYFNNCRLFFLFF